jgi:hypothetical protein
VQSLLRALAMTEPLPQNRTDGRVQITVLPEKAAPRPQVGVIEDADYLHYCDPSELGS